MAIYLNQAATSHPKPSTVHEAVIHALQSPEAAEKGTGPSQRSLKKALQSPRGNLLSYSRRHGRCLFGPRATPPPRRSRPGGSIGERLHRGVGRGSRQRWGIDVTWLKSSDPREAICALRPTTSLLIAPHACSITGRLLPVGELTSLAEASTDPSSSMPPTAPDLFLWTSASWTWSPSPATGGFWALWGRAVFTSRKSSRNMSPGQGKTSSGTPNIPGLAGLAAGVAYLLAQGNEAAQRWESLLRESLGFHRRVSWRQGIRRKRGAAPVSCLQPLGLSPGRGGFGPLPSLRHQGRCRQNWLSPGPSGPWHPRSGGSPGKLWHRDRSRGSCLLPQGDPGAFFLMQRTFAPRWSSR